MYDALLLDIGDVILDPRLAFDAFEEATGTKVDRPSGGDDQWDRVARAAGYPGWRELLRAISSRLPDRLFDPGAVALMADARGAGRRVGVLTNDAYLIQGPEFFAHRPEFAALDAFVDATAIGVRKPAPEAYLHAAAALGVAPDTIVFLDDTIECVEGALAVGMAAIQVDPADRRPAFDRARQLLELP